MPLRPLIVVTGSIHVEGGDTHSVKQDGDRRTNGVDRITITHTRRVTKDRRNANVVSTGYMRRVAQLRSLKTPFGSLVEVDKLPSVKELIANATRDVGAFNTRVGPEATARLTNCLLWEHLRGNRLAAVEGWIARGVAEQLPEVVEAAGTLSTPLT